LLLKITEEKTIVYCFNGNFS